MRGLALSGGGFRATLFHLGLVNYLYDVEAAWRSWDKENSIADDKLGPRPLTEIKHVASVSGGSILAAHLVLNWDRYTNFEDPNQFAQAAAEVVNFCQKDVRGRIVRRLPFTFWPYSASVLWRRSPVGDWRIPEWLNRSTTDSLARAYNKFLYKNARLRDLTPANGSPELDILSVNLGDSQKASVAFNYLGLDTYRVTATGPVSESIHDDDSELVARAVAASSAFPGLFVPLLYKIPSTHDFLRLTDGGVYDNLGVRRFLNDIEVRGHQFDQIIVSDASPVSAPRFGLEFFEPITIPIKAADILFRRVYDFELAAANTSVFKLVGLRRTINNSGLTPPPLRKQYRDPLHRVRTDLDRFNDIEIFALVRQGYCAARESLSLAMPPGHPSSDFLTWQPTPRLSQKYTDELVHNADVQSTNRTITTIKTALGRAGKRKLGLWRPTDPASMITTIGVIAILVAFLAPIGYWTTTQTMLAKEETQNVKREKDQEISKRDNELVELKQRVTANFKSKFALPLQTDLSIEDARVTLEDVTLKRFTNAQIFLVEYEGGPKYRTVALYDSEAEARAERSRAISELRPTANEYFPFSELCAQTPILDHENEVFICEAQGAANYGYRSILQRKISEALSSFALAEALKPSRANYFGMTKLLSVYKPRIEDAVGEDSDKLWSEVATAILTDYWGYLNPETKAGLEKMTPLDKTASTNQSLSGAG